jgi:GDP-4-dehydro-6-deoxy-D-mannose reductase
MRILITGITGFAGGHLAEAILHAGNVELHGVGRRSEWPAEWRHLASHVELRSCDLCDEAALNQLLSDVRPERIYHLAGYANVGKSFQEADAAWEGNLTATRRLYEALNRCKIYPRVLAVGSGLIYGDPELPDLSQDESAPLRPSSPYACSKAAADLVGFQFSLAGSLEIVRVRPFNQIGPRQSPQYAVAHFAKQIAAIETGLQAPILETGNLSPSRDLTDVRDMTQAYIALMERGRPGEVYNAGTGEAHSMREVVEQLLSLTFTPIEVRQRDTLLRASETNVVRANVAKLRGETGWRPQFTLKQTLKDVLDYWRGQN